MMRIGAVRVRLTAVLAVAVAAGFVVWAALGGGGRPAAQAAPPSGVGPITVSAARLASIARVLRQPIYWVGPQAAAAFELRQAEDGRVYVRYLPSGVGAGTSRALLTIATYPLTNAYALTQKAAQGAAGFQVRGGGFGFARTGARSAFVAFPRVDYQIEVYSPRPGEARRLAAGGALRPVSASAAVPERPTLVSAAELRAYARTLEQPVYWASATPAARIEFRRSGAGQLYVRYLPPGTAAGDAGGDLTVGTYRVPRAYSVTSALARQPGYGSARVGGGIAVFPTARAATNVYLAYRGSSYQVEVYDPSPGRARSLVLSGAVAPVR
jgi:hypothetical protein